MGNKALGRDLGDLLSRARPARIVRQVTPPGTPADASPADPAGVPMASSGPAGHAPDAGSPAPRVVEVEVVGSSPGAAPGADAATPAGRFGGAPVPTGSGRSPLFYGLVGMDVVVVGAVVTMAFLGMLDHPLALAGAVLAVILGAVASSVAVLLPSPPARSSSPQGSRVRVHLTRV